jgi:Zn-dependent protease
MSLSLVVCIGWIFALCIHEFCHAVVAYAGGDKSVKDKGYLTLNPIKYTDPGLTLVIPIIMLMLGGIALPGAAVYIDRSALRNRFWNSAVSAAGPFGSAVMIFVYASPFMLRLRQAKSRQHPLASPGTACAAANRLPDSQLNANSPHSTVTE